MKWCFHSPSFPHVRETQIFTRKDGHSLLRLSAAGMKCVWSRQWHWETKPRLSWTNVSALKKHGRTELRSDGSVDSCRINTKLSSCWGKMTGSTLLFSLLAAGCCSVCHSGSTAAHPFMPLVTHTQTWTSSSCVMEKLSNDLISWSCVDGFIGKRQNLDKNSVFWREILYVDIFVVGLPSCFLF